MLFNHLSFCYYRGLVVSFRRILVLFFVFVSLKTLALPLSDLQTGDIILLDMDCFSCELIENETGGPFSHSGIVLKLGSQVYVAQSLGSVHHIPLQAFLGYSNKVPHVIRPKHINFSKKRKLLENYKRKYLGMDFDHDYVWDDEKLYCSEFIYKLLKSVYAIEKFKPTPMTYDKNPKGWEIYFGGKLPPSGKLGLSPNDFFFSTGFDDDFKDMGPLY